MSELLCLSCAYARYCRDGLLPGEDCGKYHIDPVLVMPCPKCRNRTHCFYTPMEGVHCYDFRPDPSPPKRAIRHDFPWDDLLKLIAIGCALGVILGIVLKMTL